MKFKFLHKYCSLFVICTVILSCFGYTASAVVGTDSEVGGTWTIPGDSSVEKGNGNVFKDTAASDNEIQEFKYTFSGSADKQYILDMSFSIDGKIYGGAGNILYINDASGNVLGTLYTTWTGQFFFTRMPNSSENALCAVDGCGVKAKYDKTHDISGVKFNLTDPAVGKFYPVADNKYAVRLYVDNTNDYFTVGIKDVTRGDTDFTYAEHKTNTTDAKAHPFRFSMGAEDVFSSVLLTTPYLQKDSSFTVHDFKIRECYNPEIIDASIGNGDEDVATNTSVVLTADNPVTSGLDRIKIYADDVLQSFDSAPFTLSADKMTLTYTGSLAYETEYKIEIPQGNLESDGMTFMPYSLMFTTQSAPENFFDGFDSGSVSADWDLDADNNGVSAKLDNGILKVSPEARAIEQMTFKPGGNTGEYWADVSISMKGMLQFKAHPIIRILGNNRSLAEMYLTWTASPYARINESENVKCKDCGTNLGTTAVSLPVMGVAAAPGTEKGNNTKICEDVFDLRFYVNTEEGYFTCGMKREGDAGYTYATHTDSSNNTHPVQFTIPTGQTLTGIEFNSPDYSENDSSREFNIHSASIRKYIHSEMVSSTVSRDAVGVPVSSDVEFTFSKPMTSGIENVKVYENGVELPSSSLALNDDNTTLKFTVPLKYSSKYELKIPSSGVEWEGMMFKEDEFVFYTEHEVLGVTADSPKAVDADGNEISNLNALVPGDVDEVKASVTLNSKSAKDVTVIGVLYKVSGGKRILYDIIAETAKLKVGKNTFTSTDSLKLPSLEADRKGLELEIYVWDTLKSMHSVNTYSSKGKNRRLK